MLAKNMHQKQRLPKLLQALRVRPASSLLLRRESGNANNDIRTILVFTKFGKMLECQMWFLGKMLSSTNPPTRR